MDQNNEKEFKDVLQDPALGEEIGADEAAVRAAGLTHPNEVELENILAEDWDSVPDLPESEVIPELGEEPAAAEEAAADEEPLTEEAEEIAPEAPAEEEPEAPMADTPTQVIPVVEVPAPLPQEEEEQPMEEAEAETAHFSGR